MLDSKHFDFKELDEIGLLITKHAIFIYKLSAAKCLDEEAFKYLDYIIDLNNVLVEDCRIDCSKEFIEVIKKVADRYCWQFELRPKE